MMARPKKKAKDKYETRTRQVGRVDDETWSLIQSGFESTKARGRFATFTSWAVACLFAAAKRELRR